MTAFPLAGGAFLAGKMAVGAGKGIAKGVGKMVDRFKGGKAGSSKRMAYDNAKQAKQTVKANNKEIKGIDKQLKNKKIDPKQRQQLEYKREALMKSNVGEKMNNNIALNNKEQAMFEQMKKTQNQNTKKFKN